MSTSPSSLPSDHGGMRPEDVTILGLERALIGAVLWAPINPMEMPPLLADEFLSVGHQVIWETMERMAQAGIQPDLLSIQHELAKRDQLALVGGPAHVMLCYEEGHIPAYAMGLARQIREAATARKIRALGEEMASQGATVEQIQAALQELPGPLAPSIYDPALNWQRIVDDWEAKPSVATGLTSLDLRTGGLGRGRLIVVGGRQSHGKTSFACDRSLAMAKAGVRVEIVTIEDSQDDLVKKLVANLTGIDARKVLSGTLSQSEFDACEEAVRQLQELPLKVSDVGYDEGHVMAVVSQSKAEVVIVDHLQKIRVSLEGEKYNYALKRIADRCHEIARRDGKVVWLNAQLGRDMDRDKRPPTLTDLRDSGSIEESARQVLLLYWPSRQGHDRPAHEYEIHVAKNMGGTTGKVSALWDPPLGRFSDVKVTAGRYGD